MSVKLIISHTDDNATRQMMRKVIESVYGPEFFGAARTVSVQNEMPAHVTANVTMTPPALGGVIPPVDNPAAGGNTEQESAFLSTSGEWPKLVNGQQLDSEGTPYSKDIHSDPAQVTTKGVWRAKRGVDKTLAAKRASELRALVNSGAQPPASVAVNNPATLPPAASAPAPTLAPMLPPPLPTLAAAPAPAPQPPLPAYVQLMENLGAYMKSPANPAGIMEDADVSGVLTSMGLQQITDIQYSEQLLQTFAAKFNDAYGAKYQRLASGG